MQYVVGIGFDDHISFYGITLDQIKEVMKTASEERKDYVVDNCEPNYQATDAMDLWLDDTDKDFWENDGDEAWREFLIEENK